jgi:uncharacterized coiled-coil protein SlyX
VTDRNVSRLTATIDRQRGQIETQALTINKLRRQISALERKLKEQERANGQGG